MRGGMQPIPLVVCVSERELTGGHGEHDLQLGHGQRLANTVARAELERPPRALGPADAQGRGGMEETERFLDARGRVWQLVEQRSLLGQSVAGLSAVDAHDVVVLGAEAGEAVRVERQVVKDVDHCTRRRVVSGKQEEADHRVVW